MADLESRFGRPITQQLMSWTVRNFKAIEFAETPLTGLVALAGANSSGKSSLLQSLLLLAQSGDQEVTLNGSLVRLGTPRDVVRAGATALSIACSATVEVGKEVAEWHVELTLRSTQDGLRVSECAVARDGEPLLLASDSRVTERAHSHVDGDRTYGDTILRIREIGGRQAPSHTYLTFNGLAPAALHTRVDSRSTLTELRRTFSLSELRSNPEAAERFTELVFSNFYRAQVEKEASALTEAVRAVIGGDLFEEDTAARLSRSTLDTILVALSERGGDGAWQPVPIRPGLAYATRRLSPRYVSLMIPSYAEAFHSLLVANDVLSRLGSSVRYLGPLREEPQVVSKSGSRNPLSPVGLRGERTAELLSTRTRNVKFWDWDRRERRADLTTAVSLWAGYLGIGDDVSVEDQGKLGRGLRISVNGVPRDLTMIGVGASQLLPVLAVVLDAPPGSVVLLEQPELHLHPSVQSRLGDFLLFARRDVCVVVETHSEYIITRLRRRIAERKAGAENVHILFAEELRGGTEVRELRVTDLGNLDDWPRGFFDAQDEEARAIVRAIASRRSTE
ncbi:AAA family ATPase [Microbacterium sp. A1-JK]|uniref:AAA family ATPase n=1 Tax=Microbacterium sp. A1-JK TaxID=3177516 RepID=UPI003885F608